MLRSGKSPKSRPSKQLTACTRIKDSDQRDQTIIAYARSLRATKIYFEITQMYPGCHRFFSLRTTEKTSGMNVADKLLYSRKRNSC